MIRSFVCVLVALCLAGPLAAQTPPAARPNILFCIADDASYPHMSAYGCSWVETPSFDRVARQGLLFSRAYTPNAKCAPSRASILTGRNSWQLGAACNHWCHFPAEFSTYAEVLSRHGYFVGSTGKGWAPGIAKDRAGKPRQMTGKPFQRHKLTPPARAVSNNDYAANFKDFLDNRPDVDSPDGNSPWCFWYGGFEPHRAYEYGAGLSKAGKKLEQIDRVFKFWPDNEQVRTDLLDYAFEIEHFDRQLGLMLDELERRGELDNTLVVVTADNGMPFPRVKGQEYELSNHLPLAVMWQARIASPGRTIDDYVSFIDFAPTFLEVGGVSHEQAAMAPIAGRSLTGIFTSAKNGRVEANRDHVLIGKERHDIGRPDDIGYPIRGIVKNDMLLLLNYQSDRWPSGDPLTGYLNCDGSPTKTEVLNLRRNEMRDAFWKLCFGKRPAEEMFDVNSDPECLMNLADDPQYASQKKQLHQQLIAELTAQADPRVVASGTMFERFPYADKNSVNFYRRYLQGEQLRAGWVNPTDFETPATAPRDVPQTIGEIHRLDPAVDQLLPADAKIEVLAGGLEWSEGPLWVPNLQCLLFSDIPRNHIMKWQEGRPLAEFMAHSGYTGKAPFVGLEPGTNGLTLDSQGRLVICCHGDRAVKRVEPDGTISVLASHYQGKRLNSPNDLVYHSNGDLYFTDPPYGLPKREKDPAQELDFYGVYRLSPAGKLTLVSKRATRPNGIGLSPDEKTLYIAQSDRSAYLWWAFPLREDGMLGAGRVFYDATQWSGVRPGGADGMAIDKDGNLWATGPGGVLIFTPQGKLIGRLATGQRTANCTFGGKDGHTLFMTADMYLCRVQTKTQGAR